jgi:hypothetical protein
VVHARAHTRYDWAILIVLVIVAGEIGWVTVGVEVHALVTGLITGIHAAFTGHGGG